MSRRHRGFTLIELMIAVAAVGILATIAYPSYLDHVRRGARTAAQNFVADLAQRQELRYQSSRSYTNFAGLGVALPSELSARYQAPVITTVDASAGTLASFVITLAPVAGGIMANDGTLIMDSAGNRFRDMNGDGIYDAAADKTWDAR